MPSSTHQSLLLWIARKMTADGFTVTACDGSIPQGGVWNSLPCTPAFAGIRPDACGVGADTGEIAYGEAKTSRDIDTPHTRHQLRVFRELIRQNGKALCRLYIAIPRSSAHSLDRVLCQCGLQGGRSVVPLYIPDCFVTNDSDDCL